MVKVKAYKKKAAIQQKKRGYSVTDSETEYQRPKKLIKTHRNGTHLSSTPHPNSASFFDGPMTSTGLKNGTTRFEDNLNNCNFANFTSLLESYSFLSDDEGDPLTVSRLAEQRPSMHIQNDTSRRSVACLNNSIQNVSTDNIRVLEVPTKHLELISIDDEASLTLHGSLRMKVLVGTVSIHGYDVTTGKSVDIFSSKRTGYKKITTKKSVVRIDPVEIKKTIGSLTGLDDEKNNILQDFVDCIGSFTTVVSLEKRLLLPSLQFLELYFPNAVAIDFPKKDAVGCGMYYSNMASSVIDVSPDAEIIAKQLNKEFLETGPCIVVHGAKQSGKSTMLRYLVHTALNLQSEVYYLDTDPGQTEFTPPGVVSLIKVTNPILGPPYTHLRNPVKMIFTGSVTPATSPPMYTRCVRTLIDYFNTNFSQKVLFVNTIGWVEGIGDVLFQNIKAILKPNMVIDFLSPEECPDLKIEKTQQNCINVQIPIKKYLSEKTFSPKDMRTFALMSYFGKCQKYYMKPSYINEIRPVCVKWDEVAIAVMGKKVQPNRLIETIHCSVVALCHVDKTLMLESDNPELPKTLQDEAINECLGYGFVRAADETNHILYIVTPLSVDKLVRVNSIIKGDIIIPDEVYFKQPILNTPLPYTMESNTPASMKKSVKKRTFIPQQTPRNR